MTEQLRERALTALERPEFDLPAISSVPDLVPEAEQLEVRAVGRSAKGWISLLPLMGPVAAATATAAVQLSGGGSPQVALVVLLALLIPGALRGREPDWVHILPLMGTLVRAVLLGRSALAVGILQLAGALPGISGPYVALIAATAIAADAGAEMLSSRFGRGRPVRIAIVGDARVAESLDREMRLADCANRYEVVGRILATDEVWTTGDEVPAIGRVGALAQAVERHDIDLLLMSAKVPRMELFEEVARTCLHLPVRMHELSSFYEQVFCHVASTEINAAWFQYVLHPKYRAGTSRSERALDLVMVLIVAIFALPLLAIFALLIRRDGGPIFFRQTRIGEGGRPFTMYKLRTMRVNNLDSSWATKDDARVTRVGSCLRRTHLDELPQLYNVLRGEMSIVGPRPEQPQIVDQLELLMPYYQRRHLIKPGVTGWAQIRCGYAGSEAGSAWKLCHDLYYLRRRSLWLNLVIIMETFRTLIADRQYTASPLSVDFILAPSCAVHEGLSATP
jgi:exopolysaccharide biosynthesis polyprenyl glycosylphosphotransferase